MQPKKTIILNIRFLNGEAESVQEFKQKNPGIKHKDIYLKGLEVLKRK